MRVPRPLDEQNMRVKVYLMHKRTNNQSEEAQSLEKREQSLQFFKYLGVGRTFAGVVFETGILILCCSGIDRGAEFGGVEIAIGLAIVFLADVRRRRVRNRL